VSLPDPEPNEFDAEITDPFVAGGSKMVLAFLELNSSFMALLEAGFSENQALKFLAFCSIFEGDF
jgi:hypothetical protein